MPEPSRVALAGDGWFPIERAEHVAPGQVVHAMLHGQHLALWRSTQGTVQAWEDRCPHRSVRLTLGFVIGDELVCRYHGWRYGPDGRCTRVPSTPDLAPPPMACVKSHLCREADGIVWASLAVTPSGYPPRLPGLVACRGFVCALAAGVVADALASAGMQMLAGNPVVWSEAADAPDPMTVLLQPLDAATTGLHLLIAASADAPTPPARRRAAARRLQSLLGAASATHYHMAQESAHA